MPELALHFAVPFALAAPVLGLRRALLVSLIALTPDLDALLQIHRSATHSVIPLLAIVVVAVFLVHRFRADFFGLTYASGLALLSHPVMDLFSTYTPILYPLMRDSVWLKVEGFVLIGQSIKPHMTTVVVTEPTAFQRFQILDAPVFTNEGFILSLLLVAVPFLMVLGQHVRRVKLG
jgi:membrane-bound metal-dependent hydrolase YbcI (DUF457 family)